MDLIRHCIIDTTTNTVVNIIEYESVQTGTPNGMLPNFICIASDTGVIGGVYSNGEIVNPLPPVVTISVMQQIALNTIAVGSVLDKVAISRGYASVDSASSFVAATFDSSDSHQAQIHAECTLLLSWRMQTWATARAYLNSLGDNPICKEDIAVSMIPSFTWPDGTKLSSFTHSLETNAISWTTTAP